MTTNLVLAGIAMLLAATPATAQATGDALAGKRLYLRCASCHAIADNAPKKIGPNLKGIVGRQAGAEPGFNYSPAMKAKAPTWDEPTLDRWLAKPSAVVPGTSMAFAGLPKPEDRRALIAYLKTPTK